MAGAGGERECERGNSMQPYRWGEETEHGHLPYVPQVPSFSPPLYGTLAPPAPPASTMVLGMGFSTVRPALTIPTGTQSGNTACKRPNGMPTTSGLAYSGGRGERSKDACQSQRRGEVRVLDHGYCWGGESTGSRPLKGH